MKTLPIQKSHKNYLLIILILAPMLNFLTGINIDLLSPSLPSIAHYFQISTALAKEIIAISMIGFSIGCLIFGILLDSIGRRPIIIIGLTGYTLTSFACIFSPNILTLMILRFAQGCFVAGTSIGARTLVVDHFKDKQLTIAITYTSLAYILGPVFGPFIGGMIEYYFNWQVNFIVYTFFGSTLLLLFIIVVHESLAPKKPITFQFIHTTYQSVISNKTFMLGTFFLSLVVIEELIYPTIGPFIIQNHFHLSALYFGTTALAIGVSYMIGTLVNRSLLSKLNQQQLIQLGLSLFIACIIGQSLLAFLVAFSVYTFLLPLICIYFSLGFLFPNMMSLCLQIFPNNSGIASSIQACLLMGVGSIGITCISFVAIHSLLELNLIYIGLIIIQSIIFLTFNKLTHLGMKA